MQLEKGDILLRQGLNEMLELAMDRNAEREEEEEVLRRTGRRAER